MMKRFTSTTIAAVMAGLIGSTTWAADTALLIGNERYQSLPRASNGIAAVNSKQTFQRLGFKVITAQDTSASKIETSLSALIDQAESTDQVAIVLTGHFVVSGETTWFLMADARTPSLANLSRHAVPLSLIFDIAARHSGNVLVALGAASNPAPTSQGIVAGIGIIDPPQGVTVLTGTSGELSNFLNQEVLKEGVVIAKAVRDSRMSVYGHGFLPETAFVATEVAPTPVVNEKLERERAYWQFANDLGTLEAYQAYLKSYPRGIFATNARREITFIKDAPERNAEIAEKALNLTRTERRKIQSDLTLLGYNTRGIDGLFGAGTRGALTNWQADAGFAKTGFINQEQLVSLNAQALKRSKQLEEETRKREVLLRRQDRSYWQETGKSGTEKGLRSYLKRYPDGAFSDVANERLSAILQEKRDRVAKRERSIWDQTLAANNLVSYNQYLNEFPNGSFVEEAKSRIAALQGANSEQIEAARIEESKLGLAPVTFLLVEQKLTKLGFEPGRIDGKLSEETRRAIRRFQRAANLPVTGYLSRSTVVRLIAAN